VIYTTPSPSTSPTNRCDKAVEKEEEEKKGMERPPNKDEI
jgi:hypothetical protein